MDPQIAHALVTDRVIDITTTGRKSGEARRIEIWFHNLDGKLYITDTPGRPRGWYANLRSTPAFTFHLKTSVQADLPAQARPILAEEERRAVLSGILAKLTDSLGDSNRNLEDWVASSPLVEVILQEAGA
ncbi:MAG: nitroreductase/quinone reductase family protein [Caldilineaceae bacterium]